MSVHVSSVPGRLRIFVTFRVPRTSFANTGVTQSTFKYLVDNHQENVAERMCPLWCPRASAHIHNTQDIMAEVCWSYFYLHRDWNLTGFLISFPQENYEKDF